MMGWTAQVVLEFPVDDTAGGEKEDALTEMGFYVPKDAVGWGAGDQEHAAKVRADPQKRKTLATGCAQTLGPCAVPQLLGAAGSSTRADLRVC